MGAASLRVDLHVQLGRPRRVLGPGLLATGSESPLAPASAGRPGGPHGHGPNGGAGLDQVREDPGPAGARRNGPGLGGTMALCLLRPWWEPALLRSARPRGCVVLCHVGLSNGSTSRRSKIQGTRPALPLPTSPSYRSLIRVRRLLATLHPALSTISDDKPEAPGGAEAGLATADELGCGPFWVAFKSINMPSKKRHLELRRLATMRSSAPAVDAACRSEPWALFRGKPIAH